MLSTFPQQFLSWILGYLIHSGHASILLWPKAFGFHFGLLYLDSLFGLSHKKSLGVVVTLLIIGTSRKGIFQSSCRFTWTSKLTLELL